MLQINERYVLKGPNTEKVISIKTKEDLSFWNRYVDNKDYVFTRVVIHQRKEECESCSA